MVDKRKVYTVSQALSKAMDYCARSEKATFDVRNKIIQWGLNSDDADQVIGHLIEQDFLNESRFSKAYAKDKLIFNKWGKNKIKAGLFSKYVSEYSIAEALESLDPIEYQNICESLVNSRLVKELKRSNGDNYIANQKTIQYVMSKGFEYPLIEKIIEQNGNN